MALDLSKLRETLQTEDKLSIYAEYLNILESVVHLSKVDYSTYDTECMEDVIGKQKRLKELCEEIFNGLNDAVDSSVLNGLLDELAENYAEFEQGITGGRTVLK